jgi:murein DD-endopeptidase MepM/ murein hydrolase activator NlpD
LAWALLLAGLLSIVGNFVLPRVDRLGPILRYGLLGMGFTRKAAEELEHEQTAIRDRIQERQTALDDSPGAAPAFTWPTPGWDEITSPWGGRSHPILGIPKEHTGADIGAPWAADVHAVQGGEVILADQFTAYGLLLVVDHGGGWASVYAHLSQADVAEGDQVVAGQIIGAVGDSGRVTGPHLHLELYLQGKSVDPLDYISPPVLPTAA